MIMLRIRSRDGLERVVQGRVVRDGDPKLSKMKKEVVVGVKDLKEVDNDFSLVVVKILDYQAGGNLDHIFNGCK
ncbi:hypothetical protein F2Q69_00062522 [Brassica cretica]|uniref:Uncharacterized protein n=1 Tax=Brassica cretica TaxID=69181 RepID=A0A8S9RJ99_BRACR|nr:hypothetical protein F2Q69_00062522 [Brassica cretica]